MDLATIEIDPSEAKERLAEYEKLIVNERTAEDDAIAAGYRAAARGLPIIQLSKCFEIAGTFENGFPRLAVARADSKRVAVTARPDGFTFHTDIVDRFSRPWINGNEDARHALVGDHHVRVPYASDGSWKRGVTVVPLVPIRHRPRMRRLHGFHILWEVTKWDPTPPLDPALLKHIRGDLWAVMATWDLTELERAVLSARS
jgi:hypothetical protein